MQACDRDVVPVIEVAGIFEALRQHIRGTHSHALHCPRAAPSAAVVSCTCHHWFRPFSKCRRYCQLPVSVLSVCLVGIYATVFTDRAWIS